MLEDLDTPPADDPDTPPVAAPAGGAYDRVIRAGAVGLAIFGVLLGLGLSLQGLDRADTGRRIKGVIMAPIMGGLGGAALGVCLTCAVAPGGFLGGPRGREWMRLIGTQSVSVARVVCVVLGVVLTALFAGLGWVLLYAKK